MESSNITPSRLSAITAAGITAAGKMAVALTLTRTENPRVMGGAVRPSPIYGGMDAETVRLRRAAGKRQRQARAAHARGRK